MFCVYYDCTTVVAFREEVAEESSSPPVPATSSRNTTSSFSSSKLNSGLATSQKDKGGISIKSPIIPRPHMLDR